MSDQRLIKSRDALSNGEFDCALCLKLLYKPSTAACGHSFCLRCCYELLASSANSGTSSAVTPTYFKCPVCRRKQMEQRWSPATNVILEKLLCMNYPDEYKTREEEETVLAQPLPKLPYATTSSTIGSDGGLRILPLFVLDSFILPGQKMTLHVFELRYRLLVQRALAEHNRRFGMVGYRRADGIEAHASSGIPSVGTEVEILSCQEVPDGRFGLEVIGRRTFKIVDRQLRDGYWEASISHNTGIEDDAEVETEDDAVAVEGYDDPDEQNNDIVMFGQKILTLYQEWEANVRENSWERNPRHMDEVKNNLGPIPPPDQSHELALWIAAAINPLPSLGVSKEIRGDILASTDAFQRLKIVSDALNESLEIVKKRRGTVPVFGFDLDVNIILFGVFGLFIGLLVQNYCRKMFIQLGLDSALLGVHGIES